MKRYEGIVLCCDIDGTLIGDDFRIPPCNLEALHYFRSEGGLVTLATGRTPIGAAIYLDELKPDLPFVCQNGSAIYDGKQEKYVWYMALDKDACMVIDDVCAGFPSVGVEIMTTENVYTCRPNASTRKHERDESFMFIERPYTEIREPWLKAVFADIPENTDKVQRYLEDSEWFKRYSMMRSYSTYYEFIDKEVTKAAGVRALVELCKADEDKFVVIGDNDNDCEMLSAFRSFCPASASDSARACAGTVLSRDNNEGVLPALLEKL